QTPALLGDIPRIGPEPFFTFLVRDQQLAAPAQQGLPGEAGGRIAEHRIAGMAELTHEGCAMVGRVDGGRAARGVVADMAFALEQHDLPLAGQEIRERRTGNPAADDDDIAVLRHHRTTSISMGPACRFALRKAVLKPAMSSTRTASTPMPWASFTQSRVGFSRLSMSSSAGPGLPAPTLASSCRRIA